MSVEIEQLTAADWEEGLAFLNGVFGDDKEEFNFATLLPSIYQPTDEFMACNYAVRENGQIRAVVGLFPMDWQVGDNLLKVGGIGGVSTHLSVRGKGYMKLLMEHCVKLMKAEGYDLSWLGGQRQRYGYFGYEKCGQQLSVSMNSTNLRHVFGERQGLSFEPLVAEDRSRIDTAQQLHDALLVHCRRGGNDLFPRFLASWHHQPHAALDEDGTMVGYLVADASGGSVLELVARDASMEVEVARSWVQSRQEEGVRFDIGPTRYELLRRLSAIGEGGGANSSGNWQIYDWARTVGALLQVRCVGGALADGDILLGIEGYGSLHVQVCTNEVVCEKVAESAPVTWDAFTAMRVFFGPLPAAAVVDVPQTLGPLLAWCPLPLAWPRQDGV